MSLFFKKQPKEHTEIYSPLSGQTLELKKVSDEVFSSGAMGEGIAIIPNEGILYAPCDGKVTALFPTGHALGLTTRDGIEVILHIGIDTVELQGKGFESHVNINDSVKKGQVLISFDLDTIKNNGYNTTTMMVFPNFSKNLSLCFSQKDIQDICVGQKIFEIYP